jgi:glc operon protein GlcG
MHKLVAATVALMACVSSADAWAQGVYVERKQITSETARKMTDACLAFAEKNHILVAVAVVDISGEILDFHAMQGAGATAIETALLKAKTAARWQRSTSVMEHDVLNGGNQAPLWIRDFPKAGALPVMIDGQMAGAIGIGGAQKQEDCAQAGIDAVLPKQQPAAAQH